MWIGLGRSNFRKGNISTARTGVLHVIPLRRFDAMKTISAITVALCFSTYCTCGQTTSTPLASNAKTPWVVTSQGANQRVWQKTTYENLPSGQGVPHTHSYTELATGMNYWQNGQWVESKEEIDILPDGTAAAIQGQHQAYFPVDIAQGTIEVVTPDGKQLQSRPVGLSYDDGTHTVVIAILTNSVGELVDSNQVIYPNAFDGASASLCYIYTRSGFEQNVIVQGQLLPPESFGLNPETTRLQVLTEFFDMNTPVQTPSPANPQDGLSDPTLTFGQMRMVHGRAFSINTFGSQTPTYKSWLNLEGRRFLVEDVPYARVASQLNRLPAVSQAKTANTKTASVNSVLNKISTKRLLPSMRFSKMKMENQKSKITRQLARTDANQPALLLDYVMVDSDQSDFTFQGDTTYCISGNVNLSGTTVIEGGAVIKYTTNVSSSLRILDSVECQTAPYRPAIFTSSDDNTVGESISVDVEPTCTGTYTFQLYNSAENEDEMIYLTDEDGNPIINGETLAAGTSSSWSFTASLGQLLKLMPLGVVDGFQPEYDFNVASQSASFYIDSFGYPYADTSSGSLCTPPPQQTVALSLANGGTLHDLNIRDVNVGIHNDGGCSATNLQFVQCPAAFETENTSLYAGNILMSQVGTAFTGQNFQVVSEQLTYDQGTHVAYNSGSGSSAVSLTNSLITGVTDYGNTTVYTNVVFKLPSRTGVFQTIGAGGYYLTNNSYHNAGTTNISPSLLAQLRLKTTRPPVLFSNALISIVTNFSPIIFRDTNGNPDLGYHYDPLDYIFGGVEARSNVTFTAGTDIGWFDEAGGFGMVVDRGAMVTFNGTALAPCWAVRFDTVQEGGNNWIAASGVGITGNSYSFGIDPELRAQFTKFSSSTVNDFCFSANVFIARLNDCEFWNAPNGGYEIFANYTNCLFFQAPPTIVGIDTNASLTMRNCTIEGGSVCPLNITHNGSTWPVLITDCAFDGTTIDMDDYSGGDTNITYCDFNAFLSGANQTATLGGHEITGLSSYNWQSSRFGDFYLPSDSWLINAGSTTADQVGLYHFTTQTAQVPEGNSPVDIGYHYVATDPYGNPLDSNQDGIPDYLEDANGNGITDNGESFWQPIIITQQPTNQTVMSDDSVGFGISVSFSGSPLCDSPLTYQWQHDGTNIDNNIIVTVAGNGANGYSGDGGAATNASLAGPAAVAADASGNLYIVDYNTNVIRKVDTNGIITTVAGNGDWGYTGDGGAATNATFNGPDGIAVDAAGNLYIADSGNTVIRKVATNGIITTVAGNGIPGYSGDGGAATNAALYWPGGLAVDSGGNLYIADTYNEVIRKLATNGIITTVAGKGGIWGYSGDGGAATNATLTEPTGVALDISGNLYIADTYNQVVRKVGLGGTITTVAGNGTNGYSGDGGAATNANLNVPSDVAMDASGDLFIVDSGNNVIRKVAANGIITTLAGNGNAGYSGDESAAARATLSGPYGAAVDPFGNLYIADYNNSAVRKVIFGFPILRLSHVTADDAGSYQLIISGPCASVTSSIATLTVVPMIVTVGPTNNPIQSGTNITFTISVSADGSCDGPFTYQLQHDGTNIPVNLGIISTVAGNGLGGYYGEGIAATNAELGVTKSIALDAPGNLYIADAGNNLIRKVDTHGIITTIAGGGTSDYTINGIMATNAALSFPSSIAVDASGNLYIADTFDNVVRKVDTNGIIRTVAGGGTSDYTVNGIMATNAELVVPNSVSADAFGNLFIADSFNNVIREVDTNGIITTVAGNGTGSYSGDGGPAIDAELYLFQSDPPVDALGNLYIADTFNNRIRKVDTNGIITTVAGGGTNEYTINGIMATNAELNQPDSVAIGPIGNLYVADTESNIIREVDSEGIIMTIAGDGTHGYSGDGDISTNAELGGPTSVAADAFDNLYIDDSDNYVIRKVTIKILLSSHAFTLFGATTNEDGNYQVVVTGPCGSVTSSVVTVTILPLITAQPANQALAQGQTATFNVSALGTAPLNYQWYFNGSSISGATNMSLTLTNVQQTFAGLYSVVVSNQSGSATSSNAVLTVTVPRPFSGLGFDVMITQPTSSSVLP